MDLDQFSRALDCFAAHEPTHLYVHHIQLWMEVARRGRMSYREAAEALNITPSSVSRLAQSLSDTHRHGHPGLGLLTIIQNDPEEGRRHLLMLSPKGEALKRQLANMQ